MLLKRFAVCLVLCFGFIQAAAWAASPVPLQKSIQRRLLDQPASLTLVKAAVKEAAQKIGWVIVSEEQEDRLALSILVRNKHRVEVDVVLTPQNATVLYGRSENLDYANGQNGEVIHPSYQRWVNNLLETSAGYATALQSMQSSMSAR